MNFIRKIFSPTCLIISFFLLFYTFYRSEIYWNGTKSNFYLNYYIISVISLFFSIITFFLNKKIKDYLIIILASVVTSLYMFEAYIMLGLNKGQQVNKEKIFKNKTGKIYDNRTKFEIYEDLIEKDSNIKLVTLPGYFFEEKTDIFPFSAFSYSKTIHCNENGYYSIYDSDRYGFNNPDSEWDQKEIEYLLVGDSFTLGSCVNRPNDIGSVLRVLSKKPVLNLGHDDNGPLIEYATLREYLDINVNKVLWIYFEGNDLRNLKDKLSNKILKNYLSDLTFTQNLKKKQNQINELIDNLIEKNKLETNQKTKKLQLFVLKKFVKIGYLRALFSAKSEPKLIPEFREILKLANDLVINNNSELYFVYLPDYGHYKYNYNFSNYFKIKSIISELGIPFIDVHSEVFEKEENPLKLFPFQSLGHYNVDGYRKVAEAIYRLSK